MKEIFNNLPVKIAIGVIIAVAATAAINRIQKTDTGRQILGA